VVSALDLVDYPLSFSAMMLLVGSYESHMVGSYESRVTSQSHVTVTSNVTVTLHVTVT